MTSNNDIVMSLDEQYLIETNEQVLRRHERNTGEQVYIEVIPNNMKCVFPMINSVGNSGNRKDDLIEIATYILAVISQKQPFFDGNRRTGIIAAGKFLHDNGYELAIDPEDENLELREILRKIKHQIQTLNPDIMKQMSFYISKRMKPL